MAVGRRPRLVAAATTLPLVIYNVPGRTGVNIAPETVAELAQIPNITGIKEASGSLDQASAILATCKIDLGMFLQQQDTVTWIGGLSGAWAPLPSAPR